MPKRPADCCPAELGKSWHSSLALLGLSFGFSTDPIRPSPQPPRRAGSGFLQGQRPLRPIVQDSFLRRSRMMGKPEVIRGFGSDWEHSPLRSGATLKVAAQHDNRSSGELDLLLTGDLFAHDGSIGISLTSLVKLLCVVACFRQVRVEVTLRR